MPWGIIASGWYSSIKVAWVEQGLKQGKNGTLININKYVFSVSISAFVKMNHSERTIAPESPGAILMPSKYSPYVSSEKSTSTTRKLS